jgi:hypothetical protein
MISNYIFNILPVRLCECTLEVVVNMGFKPFRETLSYSHGEGSTTENPEE